jgi:undecaprenyl diphosphate synthase
MKPHPLPAGARRPRHVAVIMDGNGRWATDRGLARLEGHRKGADVVRDITTYARELEIPYLTLYSFSVQNWTRPPDEVAGLMLLLRDYCERERDTLMKNDIRLNTIGNLTRVPDFTREAVAKLVNDTADNRSMTLTLAIDYGGREELVAAVRRLAVDVRAKRINPESIDETALSSRLDTALLPDPDLVIRTSGEQRVSNFLLWQIAYAELHFTPVRWPDFGRPHFLAALEDFAARERRFGGPTKAQTLAAVVGGAADDFVLGELPGDDESDIGKGPRPC